MAVKNMSQIELDIDLELDEALKKVLEGDKREDLFRHCKQRTSVSGRILVSKKAWLVRSLSLGR